MQLTTALHQLRWPFKYCNAHTRSSLSKSKRLPHPTLLYSYNAAVIRRSINRSHDALGNRPTEPQVKRRWALVRPPLTLSVCLAMRYSHSFRTRSHNHDTSSNTNGTPHGIADPR